MNANKKDRRAEWLLIAFAVIIMAAILAVGGFDSPEYNRVAAPSCSASADFSLVAEKGKIDINNADLEELMTLEHIGEVRAKAIIAYRERNGGFYSTEEILCVDKIPQSVYYKIKDKITVGEYGG